MIFQENIPFYHKFGKLKYKKLRTQVLILIFFYEIG